MSPILKVEMDEQDEEQELEFELDYLATLTVQQRFGPPSSPHLLFVLSC